MAEPEEREVPGPDGMPGSLLGQTEPVAISTPSGYDFAGERRGDSIGPYRLLEAIGEGGFGIVWLAERREPYVQRVALKIIKPGMDSRAVIARFEQERQALAVMDHPNVAKVLDGGITPASMGSRPFFVMEHVKGESITAFCDRQKLTVRQRLELFIPVCEAVQHAHHKGLIHRDLKPSNVLVTVVDTAATSNPPAAHGHPGAPAAGAVNGLLVKVIDFGVAKAISHTLTDKTIFTERGTIIGTPEYMSPEQAEMGATDVDTRTDVYSLGVLLYELLTGVLPFEPRELRSKGYAEIQRIIRDVDPPRPSTRLTNLRNSGEHERSTAIARKRQAGIEELARQLRRELEWIPLKAMRKDRAHRYATARDLADDVRNYLAERALDAGPESGAYRIGKILRRHRLGVSAAALVSLALVAGLVATSIAARWALRERDRADTRSRELEQVADFQASMLSGIDAELMGVRLREDILAEARAARERARVDPGQIDAEVSEIERQLAGSNFTNAGVKSLRRNVLERAIQAIDAQFAGQPLVRARLLATVGQTLRTLGSSDAALAVHERALKIRREQLGEDHPDSLTSMHSVAQLFQALGRLAEAESLFQTTLDAGRRVLGEDHPDTLTLINDLGFLRDAQGNYAEADRIWRDVLERRRRILGEDHPDTLRSIGNVGYLLREMGKLSEAEPFLREALTKRRRILGDDHPDTLVSIGNLSHLLRLQGKLADAEPYSLELLRTRSRILGDDHPDTVNSVFELGQLRYDQHKFAEAEQIFGDALERRRRTLGENHPDTITAAEWVGVSLTDQGRVAEAEPIVRDTLERRRRILGNDHPDTLASLYNLSRVLRGQEKLKEAEPIQREVLEKMRRAKGEDHFDTLKAINNMGTLLDKQGRMAEAEPLYREALERQRRVLGDDHSNTLTSMNNLAWALQNLGRLADAEPLYRELVERTRRTLGDDHPFLPQRLADLGALYQKQGRPAEAEPLLQEAYDRRRRTLGEDHRQTLHAANELGDLLNSLEKFPESESLLRALLERERRVLEDDDALTMWTIHNLGFTLMRQGRAAEAEPFCHEAAARRRSKLGEGHPHTLNSMGNLASVLVEVGRAVEAEAVAREVVERGAPAWGADSWRLGNARAKLGRTLGAQDRFEEAESELLAAHATLAGALGEGHEQSRRVAGYLADLYERWHTREAGKGFHAKSAQWRESAGRK